MLLSHFCYKTGGKVAFLSKMWAADVPYAVKSKTGPIFALFKVKNWSIFFVLLFYF